MKTFTVSLIVPDDWTSEDVEDCLICNPTSKVVAAMDSCGGFLYQIRDDASGVIRYDALYSDK